MPTTTTRGAHRAPRPPARLRRRTVVELAVVLLVLTAIGSASTAQGAGQPGVVHLTAAGDFGMTANTAAVLDAMHAQSPDLTMTVGDLSYAATGSEQAFCDQITAHLGAGYPFELLAGNHESSGQNGNINDFSACLPNQLPGLVGTYGRQYYVDVPRDNPLVRFVMISPALPFSDGTWSYAAGTPRYNWTAAAIDGARAAGVPWVVVGMHEPCWSLGQYDCAVGTDLANMLISKRVDLVLTGHEHLYQRTKQLANGGACPSVPAGSYSAACVADAGSSLVQGAGTVFSTVGTGGVELRPVTATDPEAGYFAASMGSNSPSPTYGFLDVSATADQLSARFVPTGPGTFTDAFTITRGAAPPNQAPIASFTSSAQGLTASVDGSSSSDPDGTIASWAWDFGDGGTASGPTASHTYASAGTYTVGLTVTDGSGAIGTVTHPVTVSAPPPPTTAFVQDGFNRTVTGGLGSADTGGAWTTSGTTSNFSVAPTAAALRLASPGTTLASWLGATTRTDTDLRLTLALDKVPTGSGVYLDVVGRRVASNNEYRARLVMGATGRITVQLTALKGTSSPVALASAVTVPGTYAAGSSTNVRMQVTGTSPTTVRLKVWPAGTTEPTAWQTTGTDTTAALQSPGAVGLTAYLSSSVTNAPVTVRMSALSAQPTA